MGTYAYGWQDTEAVLSQFGTTRGRARREYLRFMEVGVNQGRRVELQGGGLIRSAGGWQAVHELRRGREKYAGDERILGSSAFVERVRQEVSERRGQDAGLLQKLTTTEVIQRVCQAVGVRVEELQGGAAGRQ